MLPPNELLITNAKFTQLFDYELIKDRINGSIREDFLKKVIPLNDYSFHVMPSWKLEYSDEMLIANANYTLNEPLLSQVINSNEDEDNYFVMSDKN